MNTGLLRQQVPRWIWERYLLQMPTRWTWALVGVQDPENHSGKGKVQVKREEASGEPWTKTTVKPEPCSGTGAVSSSGIKVTPHGAEDVYLQGSSVRRALEAAALVTCCLSACSQKCSRSQCLIVPLIVALT